MQGFGLLVRSDLPTWWPRLSPIFAEALTSPKVASMVKASIMLNLGKAAYYMEGSDPYLKPIQTLLFQLSSYENVLISEPATYALANMALIHVSMQIRVKELLLKQIAPASRISEASEAALRNHLKTWCKFVSNMYTPVLQDCAHVVCSSTKEQISSEELDRMETKARLGSKNRRGTSSRGSLKDGGSFLAPNFFENVSSATQGTSEETLDTEGDEGEEQVVRSEHKKFADRSAIARDPARLYDLCSRYSASVLESVILLLSQPDLLEDVPFLDNLRNLINLYKVQPPLSCTNISDET